MGFDTQSITFNAGRLTGALGVAYYGVKAMYNGISMAPGGIQVSSNGVAGVVGIKIVIENGAAL